MYFKIELFYYFLLVKETVVFVSGLFLNSIYKLYSPPDLQIIPQVTNNKTI